MKLVLPREWRKGAIATFSGLPLKFNLYDFPYNKQTLKTEILRGPREITMMSSKHTSAI